MAVTVEEEVNLRVVSYMEKSGIPISSWYVGVASKPKDRLFLEHLVSETEGLWIIKDAVSEEAAREVERSIVEKNKTQGHPGSEKGSPRYAYAFVVTKITIQHRSLPSRN